MPSARFSWKAVSVHSPAIPVGQCARRDFLHRLQSLSGGDARRRAALHRDGLQVVVADLRRRTGHDLEFDKAAQRDHLPVLAAHIDAINVVEAAPILRLRLHLDLPGAAEQIDVVDIVAAERGLQRLEDVVERHA